MTGARTGKKKVAPSKKYTGVGKKVARPSKGVSKKIEGAVRKEPLPGLPRSRRRRRQRYPFESRLFAGIWLSETGPVHIKKGANAHMHPTNGVVAVSGTVPVVISAEDLTGLEVGDHLFIGFKDPKIYTTLPLDPANHPDVAFAVAGQSSHQQLAVAPVSLEPPDTSRDMCWGVPQFSPVVMEHDFGALPYRQVKGADHGPVPDEDAFNGVDSGFRSFHIVGESELRTYLADVPRRDGTGPRFTNTRDIEIELERRFIGTLFEAATNGTAMVELGAFLVHR